MSIKYTKSSINLSEQHVHQPVVYQQVNPNLITNGNFDVYQLEHVTRNSLASPTTQNTGGGILYADGWYFGDSGGEAVVTREQFDEFKPEFTDSRYYTRITVNRGNNNMGLTQKLYGLNNMIRGRTVTMSFWARGTVPGGKQTSPWFTSVMGFYDRDTDTVWRRDGVETEDNFWLEPHWKKYTMTLHFDPENTPGWSKETGHGSNFTSSTNNSFFYVYPIIQRNTDTNTTGDYHYDICDVKLELGPTATPFQQPDPITERMKCFQYVEPIYTRENCYDTFALGRVNYKRSDASVQGDANLRDNIMVSDAGDDLTLVITTHEYKTQKPHNPSIIFNNWTHPMSGDGTANTNVVEGIKVYGDQTASFGSKNIDRVAAVASGKNMTRMLWYVIDPAGDLGSSNDIVHFDIGLQQPSAYAVL